jgi:GntP family gluconate:H+ symporter
VILLDLCGAGAFGYVVAQSGLGQEIYRLGHFLPALLLPFLLSAALQLAQGSRVVTATVATQILAGYPLPAVTLALLIASGAFMFSYVTDPYFWLIKSSTGASMKQTILGYTLPLSLLGLAAFAIAAMCN